MINNKDGNILFKNLNPKILKYLKKYNNIINRDNLYEIRNDIFINLCKNYDKLPKDTNDINKYVYITCKNYVLNYSKKIKKYSFIEYTDNNDIIEYSDTKNNNIDNNYISDDFHKYKISKMKRLNQEIINYKNMGYSLNEISKLTNKSKTSIYRIFNKIKEDYDNI